MTTHIYNLKICGHVSLFVKKKGDFKKCAVFFIMKIV